MLGTGAVTPEQGRQPPGPSGTKPGGRFGLRNPGLRQGRGRDVAS